MAELRPNRIKQKLRTGTTTLAVTLDSCAAIEAVGALGIADGVILQMEHGPNSWRDLADLSRAADLWDMSTLACIMHGDPWLIGRTLDCGAQGVIVPHCTTAIYAREIAAGALYPPKGKRGVSGANRHALGVADYLHGANDEIFVQVTIEDVEALDNLDEILAQPNIDCFFVAPNDLAASMGDHYLGRPSDPAVQRLVDQTLQRIIAAGRNCGTLVNDADLDHHLDLGVKFFAVGVQRYVDEGLKALSTKLRSN